MLDSYQRGQDARKLATSNQFFDKLSAFLIFNEFFDFHRLNLLVTARVYSLEYPGTMF